MLNKLLPALQLVLAAKAELCCRIHRTSHNAKLAPLVFFQKATDASRKLSKNPLTGCNASFHHHVITASDCNGGSHLHAFLADGPVHLDNVLEMILEDATMSCSSSML